MSYKLNCKKCDTTKGTYQCFYSKVDENLDGWYCIEKCLGNISEIEEQYRKCRSCAKMKAYFDHSPFNCNECHNILTTNKDIYICIICHDEIDICNKSGDEDKMEAKLSKYEKCYNCMCKEDKCVDCGKSRNAKGKYWRCEECIPKFLKRKSHGQKYIKFTKNANTEYNQNTKVKINKTNLHKLLDPFDE